MSGEKPATQELVAAVIRLFDDELLEQIDPPDLKFKALIARNVLQIVERELDQGATSANIEARALRDFGAEEMMQPRCWHCVDHSAGKFSPAGLMIVLLRWQAG